MPVLWLYFEFLHSYGDFHLVGAASTGNAREVEARLRRGSPVESYHIEGSSALWWAVSSGDPETVRVMLIHGADPNSRGQWDSVIEQAAGNLELYGDEPHRKIARMLLSQARRIKDPAQVKLLRDALRDSDARKQRR